ncbi:hypothetical protein SAMN05216383_1301 [Prevotella sp. KH2C16]|nr:hypothetical protein SAMN05216383_1301 [Prevotella sp. KH2C16]
MKKKIKHAKTFNYNILIADIIMICIIDDSNQAK